jgi:hypothetical protein
MIGEWMLHKFFHLDKAALYDTTPRNFQNDKRRDALIEGKRIEVKTTFAHSLGIRVETREKRNPADFYALFTISRTFKDAPFHCDEKIECIFHGFVSKKVLLSAENLQMWPHSDKKYYCLSNKCFKSWEDVQDCSTERPPKT